MLSDNQKKILNALLGALRPVARILLRSGIGYREFSEIAKTAFVDVSSSDYGIRGRPTNISRIAAMTGLTRKEVKRIRDKLLEGEASAVYKIVPASDVLHFWFTDPDYLDDDGNPLPLPFEGRKPSFATLVREYGGDIPPGAMRTELKRVGAITEDRKGTLMALRRSFSRPSAVEKVVQGFGGLSFLAQTIAHNVDTTEVGGSTKVQRTVETRRVRPQDVNRLRRISSDRLIEFSESIDDLFGAYESLYEDDLDDDGLVLGVGLYYFEDRD